MKRYHYILLALSMILASCSLVYEPDVETPPAEGYRPTCGIVVSLAAETPVEKSDLRTRADETWNDPYDSLTGSTYENSIQDVFMYIVTPDDVVYPLETQLFNVEDGAREYKVNLKLGEGYAIPTDRGTYLFTGRLVAVANLKGGMPSSPFENLTYNISDIDRGGYLPMWGVTDFKNVELRADATISGGTITMLRSLPKLTIELADNIDDKFRIISVSSPRNDFNLVGNCQPTGGDQVLRTSSLSIEGCFNSYEDTKGPSPAARFNSQTKTTIYLPEMICKPDASGLPPYYDVTIARADGTGLPISGKVYLCDYEGGRPVIDRKFSRIVRNHDYQFIIDLAELEFTVSFREWIFGGKVHIELE
ncbi:MAG: hypothetical protein K2M31_05650 [Muribaculaceae bacterium]|nr:hypothetical protein [Muribaculaceae bacterium]